MAKDPAFLLYPGDFLTGTYMMSDAQVGRYIRLLCLQHQHGHLSEKQMLFICGEQDPDIWDKFLLDENGFYYNARLEEEIRKRESHCQKQRDNISRRWGKSENSDLNGGGICVGNTVVIPKEYGGNTTVLPLENENINIDLLKDKALDIKTKDNVFNKFWSIYPKKKSKGEAIKAWNALKPDSELAAIILTKVAEAKTCKDWLKDGGQYIPYPATWLRARGWEDENEVIRHEPKRGTVL